MTNRRIAHVDLDAFFASVEQTRNPDLSGKPVVVAGSGRRGAVASASYAARAAGVRSAMSTYEARQRCRGLVVVEPDMELYRTVSRKVMAELGTVGVEVVGIDEAYVDVSGVDDERLWARTLRRRVKGRLGLVVSVGVGSSKVVAKVASGAAKPDGIVVVGEADTRTFLARFDARKLPGVGPVTAQRLATVGIHTVADLQQAEPGLLEETLGAGTAERIGALAVGRDTRGVERRPEAQSVGRFTTFDTDVGGRGQLRDALGPLIDDVSRSLTLAGKGARTVTVRLRERSRRDVVRSVTLTDPISSGAALQATVDGLLDATSIRFPLRGAGVTASNFAAAVQEDLFTAAGSRFGFHIGDRVQHTHFGHGVVAWMSGSDDSAVVRFDDGATRDLDLSIAPMTTDSGVPAVRAEGG